MAFIQDTEKKGGGRVYVHCRAGHGRSAAVVFAWLLYKTPNQDPEELNAWLVRKRNVRRTLWNQPNIKKFHSWVNAVGSSSQGLDDFKNQCDVTAERLKIHEPDEETEEDTSIDTTSDYDTRSEEVELLSECQEA